MHSKAGSRRCAPRCLGRGLAVLVGPLQHQVGLEDLFHLCLQLEGGELQQADRLLQLGGHGQVLTESELEGLLHG